MYKRRRLTCGSWEYLDPAGNRVGVATVGKATSYNSPHWWDITVWRDGYEMHSARVRGLISCDAVISAWYSGYGAGEHDGRTLSD
jgi:hypothetical protein